MVKVTARLKIRIKNLLCRNEPSVRLPTPIALAASHTAEYAIPIYALYTSKRLSLANDAAPLPPLTIPLPYIVFSPKPGVQVVSAFAEGDAPSSVIHVNWAAIVTPSGT